jgi:hypothetical protein
MVTHTTSNVGGRMIAVSAALFLLLAVSVGAMHTTAASAQTPSIYVNGTGGSSSTYGSMYGSSEPNASVYVNGTSGSSTTYSSMYGSNDPNASAYGSMYGNGYVSSYPYSSTYYGSTFPSMTTTTYAAALTPTYDVSGAYCTPSSGTGQIWVPAGASAASIGC